MVFGNIRWNWEHGLPETCRGNGSDLQYIFQKVVNQDRTGRLMEVREQGYTILEEFADPNNPQFLANFQLPFQQPDDAALAGRTQVYFFPEVLQTLYMKASLTGDGDSHWKAIFNFSVETLDEADRRKGLASISSTSHFTMETMIQSWLGQFRCFFDL